MNASIVAVLGLMSAANNAQPLPCFEEFHQVYEYDDGARLWLEITRPVCGNKSPPGDPGAKGLHRGRIEIKRSGENIYFREDTYTWIVEHAGGQMCTGAREIHEQTTKVVIDGNYHELVEKDGKKPRRKQEQRKTLNIPNIPKLPADTNRAPFKDLGTSTIAGHTCKRYRAELAENSSGEFCVMQLAPKCPAARSLLSLEQVVAEGNQYSQTKGRTTLLKTGRRGEVFAAQEISPP